MTGPHALEESEALLGALILTPQWLDHARLNASHFYDPTHAALWDELKQRQRDGRLIDMLSLRTFAATTFRELGGANYLLELSGRSAVTSAQVAGYADAIRDAARRRAVIDACKGAVAQAEKGETDALAALEQRLQEIASDDMDADAWERLGVHACESIERAELGETRGISTGFPALDRATGGLQPGTLWAVGGATSMGKAQPLRASILLANGEWRTMGEIAVGDALASVDGQASEVVAIHPQPGTPEIYRVALSDGRFVEATGDHLWRVSCMAWARNGGSVARTLTTLDLRELLAAPMHRGRIWIEPFTGDFGSERDIGIDPWLLGAWLGDGCGGSHLGFTISTASPFIVGRLESCAAARGLRVRKSGKFGHSLTTGYIGGRNHPLLTALDALGVRGTRSFDKFIPRICFAMSERQRLELIRGLMDTDGWVETFGCVRFSSASEQLATDVADLVRSLGCWAAVTRRAITFTHRGETKTGRDAHTVTIAGRDDLFSLPEKLKRCAGRQRKKRLTIVSVQSIGMAAAQCITVSHPSNLYITDGYTPTHNSAFGAALGRAIAAQGYGVAETHLEMCATQIGLRTASALAFRPDHRAANPYYLSAQRGDLTREQWAAMRGAAKAAAGLPIYIDARPGRTLSQIEAAARRLFRKMRREGVQPGALIIDHEGLIAPEPGARYPSQLERANARSEGLLAAAKRLGVAVVALSQITKEGSRADGEDRLPQSTDLNYGSALSQAASVVILLHRRAYYAERKPDKIRTPEDWEALKSRETTLVIDKARGGMRAQVSILMDMPTAAAWEPAA